MADSVINLGDHHHYHQHIDSGDAGQYQGQHGEGGQYQGHHGDAGQYQGQRGNGQRVTGGPPEGWKGSCPLLFL